MCIADVRPFTRVDGRYGQSRAPGTLRYDDAAPNGARLIGLLDAAERRGAPIDLLIGQMWHGYIDRRVLAHARERYGVVVVNIGMDDRHAFEVRRLGRRIGTKGLAPCLDLAATAAPEAVDWFLKEGCPAVFVPEASDPNLFRPKPDSPKRYDVAFVGACYGIRRRIIAMLERAGVHVEARGNGWPRGRIATPEVPDLFAQSRIILGVGTVGQSRSLVALKLRDFDGPMSGSCYVTQANPDLSLVYDVGRELAVYLDEADAVQVVRALLIDDERRTAIADAGRSRAARDHTWAHRFEQLFAVLQGSRDSRPSGADLTPRPLVRLAGIGNVRCQRVFGLLRRVALRGMNYGADDPATSGELHVLDRIANSRQGGGTVVFDVGANVGAYARLTLERLPDVELHCFEPSPHALERLRVALERYPAVHVHPFGLGRAEALEPLYGDSPGSELASVYARRLDHHGIVSNVQGDVPLRRLDDVLPELGLERVDLLKLDVEGHELAVLEGAGTCASRRPAGSNPIRVRRHAYRRSRLLSGLLLPSLAKLPDLSDSSEWTLAYRHLSRGR